MSRIAGIVSRDGAESGRSLVGEMMATWGGDAGWVSHCQGSGMASFGWSGWQKTNIANVDGVLAVVDGHFYNRAELGSAESDAALLVSLYLKYGFAGALRKINGDFAIALYDSALDTLWLGRDRLGLKPLYYVSNPDRFGFASQPRALLMLPGVSRDVNRQFVALFAASHYRYFDNEPDKSPYQDIAQLPAAHLLTVSKDGVKKDVYWSVHDAPDFTESDEELAARYRELLLDSVSLRLGSAPRPAFTLSGGMDSSSVLALAVRLTEARQHAFSTVYVDRTYDESEEIRSMLTATVAEWHQVPVGTPDVFDLVRRMIRVHDEPVATATWLSHFILCEEAARQGFKTLFGGLGGDELNAGEYEYFLLFFADLQAAGRTDKLRHETERWIAYHDHAVFRKSFEVMRDSISRLVDLTHPGKCLPDQKRLRRYYDALDPHYFDLDAFEPVMDHPFDSYLKNRAYQDIFRETAPCCLRAEDRQTVAFGLDNVLPFFDYRLVEFMFRVGGTLKIRNGVTKYLLREAMRGVLPEETRTRIKKTGWNAPAHVWFSGDGHDLLMDLVNSQSFRQRGIYNLARVNAIIDEHEQIVSSGRPEENHMMFLWQLVNLELWLQSIENHNEAPDTDQVLLMNDAA